ncbi:MAG: GNAT family N-acetyltransferase, partial [Actinomycetota bacterium]
MRLQPDFPLRTERLLLRPYGRQDFEYLADVASRPEVVRYLYEDVRDRQEVSAELELRARLRSIQKEGDRLLLVAETSEERRVVGDVNLHYVSEQHRRGEVGWVFHPDHQGQGYATEAAAVMLRLGFDELGLHRI